MSTGVGDLARALPDYEIGREVGRGQFGIVWSARHRQLGRAVAVKQLADPATATAEHSARFRREARLLAEMSHPHVVTVYDYREDEQVRLLVMELLTGGTFADRRAAGMTLEGAIASTLAAAAGLHHVHRQGILHRDVKPENLMFDGRGTLKVTDFGIARGDLVDGSAIDLTHAGRLFGTPAYVSPEQAARALGATSEPIGPASDQYSLAAVLYEALSDELTHDRAGGAVALCTRRMQEDPRPLHAVAPGVPPGIEVVIMRALSRDPLRRYATTAGFGRALEQAAADALGPDWRSAVDAPDDLGSTLVDDGTALRAGPASTASERDRPSGVVTLLFSDIEGSTKLWEADSEAMNRALARHDALVRAAIEAAAGYVFKTVGDAFCAAFADPVAAVDAAAQIQRAIRAERWPTATPIAVRIAIHTGSCEERDGDYFGRPLNRVARLEAIGHGGQTLLSGTTADLVAGRTGEGIAVTDLGEHRLKDLDRPERVWQLAVDSLPTAFAPLRSLSNPRLRTNIPTQASNFIGRDRELAELGALVETQRLTTIVGPGGVGKTRLALQAAIEQLDGSGDGVWLVELGPISDPGLVPAAVVRSLGLRDDPARDPVDHLVDICGDRDTLIVLDNCEHVIDTVAKLVDALVQHCPGVDVLATSREPLNLRGEQVYRVPPLPVPPAAASMSEVLAATGVQLFVERATQHRHDFVLDEANAPIVASICRRLDGIPLAIQLAAARVRSLSIEQLDARLDQRFRILTGGARTDEPRQQTLRALVDWSWELLTAPERTVLARAGVFSGGFDLEAAEAVIAGGEEDEPWTVLDHLSGLVDKSLVEVADDGRYRLLETMRAFANEKLEELGDREARADAHLAYYLGLAEAGAPHLRSHDQLEWWTRLDPELDNFTPALRHARGRADPTSALRLLIALRSYWSRHGLHAAALEALDTLLERPGPAIDARVRGRALIERAWHDARLGRYEDGNRHSEEAIRAARGTGDPALLALALLTSYYDAVGAPEKSAAYVDEAFALASQLGDDYLTSCALQRRAGLVRETDPAESRRCIERSLALDAAAGDEEGVVMAHLNLALLDLDGADTASARAHAVCGLEVVEAYANPTFEAELLAAMAWAELGEGHRAAARRRFTEALARGREVGDQSIMAEAIVGLAMTEPAPVDAAVLHGAADTLLEHAGALLAPTDERARQADVDRLRAELGDLEYGAHYARGRSLSRSEIVAVSLRR